MQTTIGFVKYKFEIIPATSEKYCPSNITSR